MGGLEAAATETQAQFWAVTVPDSTKTHSPYDTMLFSVGNMSVFSERSNFQSHLHQKTFLFWKKTV